MFRRQVTHICWGRTAIASGANILASRNVPSFFLFMALFRSHILCPMLLLISFCVFGEKTGNIEREVMHLRR
jgi:hypothetical protein